MSIKPEPGIWKVTNGTWAALLNSRRGAAALVRDTPGKKNGMWRHGCYVLAPDGAAWEWTGDRWQRRLAV